jgi:hypothetical protein
MSKFREVGDGVSGLEECLVVITSYLVMLIVCVNYAYHVSVSAFVGLVSVRVNFWWCSDTVMVVLLLVKDLLVIYSVCYGAYLMCDVASVLGTECFGHEIFTYFNE